MKTTPEVSHSIRLILQDISSQCLTLSHHADYALKSPMFKYCFVSTTKDNVAKDFEKSWVYADTKRDVVVSVLYLDLFFPA